jgi:hypothetical protein
VFKRMSRDQIGIDSIEFVTPRMAYRIGQRIVRSAEFTSLPGYNHGFLFAPRDGVLHAAFGRSEYILKRLRSLAALYLPPDHREAIADRLGCADRPEEFWHHWEIKGSAEPGVIRCDCQRIVIALRRITFADGPSQSWPPKRINHYYAGLCESPDGLSGCGKVWWTRRDGPPRRLGVTPDGRTVELGGIDRGDRGPLEGFHPPTA